MQLQAVKAYSEAAKNDRPLNKRSAIIKSLSKLDLVGQEKSWHICQVAADSQSTSSLQSIPKTLSNLHS